MVSFHTTQRNIEDLSKKRKWDDEFKAEDQISYEKPQKVKTMTSLFGTHLHLETPLPLEWQRCLDIKSGHIYFYNTRTQKRTSRDPRLSTTPEPPTPVHMSLDLELNLLPCGSPEKSQNSYFIGNNKNSIIEKNSTEGQGLITRSPSWLTFDVDQQEMVTAVCKKCHMLVMMSTSSPTCPNCKFVNPPDDNPPTLFKRRLSSF